MFYSFNVVSVGDPVHRRASHMKSGASPIQRKRTESFRADVHVDAAADLTAAVEGEGDFDSSGAYAAGGGGASSVRRKSNSATRHSAYGRGVSINGTNNPRVTGIDIAASAAKVAASFSDAGGYDDELHALPTYKKRQKSFQSHVEQTKSQSHIQSSPTGFQGSGTKPVRRVTAY